MMREYHVRFRERLEGKFLRPTRLKGQLSEPGVYIWKVRGSYLNGDTFIKMGDITLLKNR